MTPPRRYFTAPRLDRAAELRGDPEALARRLADEDSLVLPVRDGRVAVRAGQLGWVPGHAFDQEGLEPVFLGLDGGRARFAVRVAGEGSDDGLAADHELEFHGLRRLAATLDGDDAGLGAYALAMDLWLSAHRFCGACGARTRSDQGGFRLQCSGCGKAHFPRLDPAIIVSVRHGDACLLGRQAAWPERRYSVLAGFVEPGEALEDAVAREVWEEAGVRVAGSRYLGSQPWPFPSSLMIGFTATAEDEALTCGEELEDVRWFEPNDLAADIAAGRVVVPPPLSISRYLIDDWLLATLGHDASAAEVRGRRGW